MAEKLTINTNPQTAAEEPLLRASVASRLKCRPEDITGLRIIHRSVDARQRRVKVNLTVMVSVYPEPGLPDLSDPLTFEPVGADAAQVVIAGAGPAGLFAALQCIRRGMRPVILERGRDVDTRRLDIAALCREELLDADSNYCFGEGGAGTFSDGKLFTRSRKRGDPREVLQILHQHGASADILSDSHPHIGSNRLPGVIREIRRTILRCGGEVRFGARVEDLLMDDNRVTGVRLAGGEEVRGPVVLATGHSARDVYRMLAARGIRMETKGFAMGVRLEHPQKLIDRIQYHDPAGRGKWLPAAEYNFVTQADGRGVYSFCMCPGGVIVPAVSAAGEQVVNGMSASQRSGAKANSGMVVEIRPGDFPEMGKYGVFSLLEMQEQLERTFYRESDNSLNAPAQRMRDFVEGKDSEDLPSTTYVRGIHPARLDKLLPPFIADRLRSGMREFGRRCPGFLTNEAVLIGLESRTSSPVRIPRDRDTLRHPDHPGLYPAGEGAGYAGGIVSAAIDGMRAADAIASAAMHH